MLTERNVSEPMLAGEEATLESRLLESDTSLGLPPLGLLPVVSLASAAGFALVSLADYASRRQFGWAEPLFWIGMTLLLLPPVLRLVATGPSRVERIGLLLVLTTGLYLVKVAYSPVAFTFPDELAHQYNLQRILQTGRLFQPNPVLAITALYPGLAGVTAAVASTSGLSDFDSGLLVIGASRIVLVLTVFLLVEYLTRSARVAALAALLYTANPNYLFYSAEYGYEALALPLSVLVIFAILRRGEARTREMRAGWTACAILAALAVAISHHLTSYALAAALWGLVIVSLLTRKRAQPAPWDLAALVSIGVAAWFALVASATWLYLSTVLRLALVGILRLITLQQAPRQVFDPSGALGAATPVWQELFAVGSVVLIAIGLPFGLWYCWRRSRQQSIALLLGLAGAAYIPLQLLRLTPDSWETANRSSEFLFVGVAFLLSVAIVAERPRGLARVPGWLPRVGLGAYVLVIFLGGVVVSWRPDLRLPRPYLTLAVGRVIEPEGVTLADWAQHFLGANNSVATDESNALLLAAYGRQNSRSGSANGIRSMLLAPTVDASVRTILSGVGARYVVLDRRLQSSDHLVGIYPLPGAAAAQPSQLLDAAAVTKFDLQPDASRIADTGDIVVYDVSRLSGIEVVGAGH